MPQTIGVINGEVDSSISIKETADELVIPAILAREGVLAYQKGNMLRSADELKAALFTFNKAWVTAEKHPEPLISIITDRKKQIKGDLSDIRLDPNAVMPNGKKSAAVKANVHLIKSTLSPQFIEDVKTGRKRDVSVGFLFDTVEEKGNWQGEPYDFKQENILINHVAVGVPVGRMRAPFIGLGCDQADVRVDENLIPTEEHRMGADPETTSTEVRIPVGTCNITATIDISKTDGITALYCGKEKAIHTYIFDKAKGWDMTKAEAWIKAHGADSSGADALWDSAYVSNLPDSAFAHVEAGGTKDADGKTVPRSLRHMPYKNRSDNIDYAHLTAALAALGGARSGSPPPYAAEAKKKLCAAVRSWNKDNPNNKIASAVCGTSDCGDQMTPEEIDAKIVELQKQKDTLQGNLDAIYAKRNALQKELQSKIDELYSQYPSNAQKDEINALYVQLDDLSAQIRLFREAKVEQLVGSALNQDNQGSQQGPQTASDTANPVPPPKPEITVTPTTESTEYLIRKHRQLTYEKSRTPH